MEERYINRYRSFCRSLAKLKKSRTADPLADFVLEGTVQNFNLTFDISWKVMKDLITKRFQVLDFALGSPREVLEKAYQLGLIEDDEWLRMLRLRNNLAHDYDGAIAMKSFNIITDLYYPLLEKFQKKAEQYYTYDNAICESITSFSDNEHSSEKL